MFILKDLNNPILTLGNKQILDLSGTSALTYKKAFVAILEMHRPRLPGAGEGLKAFNLGIKIQEAKEDFKISEDDFKFLREAVKNSPVFISIIVGRLHNYLEKVEFTKSQEKDDGK